MVIKTRKAIESTYKGICTIAEYKPVENIEDMTTSDKEVIIFENQPCRLSFTATDNSTQGEMANAVTQTVKLFISPDIVINSGSKITVTQSGKITEYCKSGEAAVYDTHQEIKLELFKEWC